MTGPLAVTGATGRLGAAVLRAVDRPVRALVRPGSQPPPGVEVVVGDLGDADALARLVDGACAVLHLATAMGAADADTLFEVNVGGTRRLVAAAGGLRLIFTSSAAARRPNLGPYARSKAQAEAIVLGAGGVVLRLPVLYGPGTQVEGTILGLASALPLVPTVHGAGLRPLHIDDAAAACLAAVDGGDGRYTLSGPDVVSFPGFARRILRAAGKRGRVLSLPGRPTILAATLLERLGAPLPATAESLRAAASGSPPTDRRAARDLRFSPRSLAAGMADR